MGRDRRASIKGAWVFHRHEMRLSPAWRALPNNARRVLDKLEVVHMDHGGSANGRLVCTFDDFAAWGIRKASVALAVREAVNLGFLTIERLGYRAAGGIQVPHLYRLTYVASPRDKPPRTDDWERIATAEQAREALRAAAEEKRLDRQPKGRSKGEKEYP